MMKNEQLIADLRKTLLQAKVLSDVLDAFFDLVEQQDLVGRSSAAKDKKLKQIVGFIVRTMLQDEKAQPKVLISHLKGTDFYHGMVQASGKFGQFLYFKDIDHGLVGLGSMAGPMVHTARFSVAETDKPTSGIIPPLGPERYTKH
ncbi:hypothetical protein LRB11_15700 [Ectothiorhodospira haloalkaliphila]|nr:hypothetical protein [Ectothiorhodospira haloalkaliphila]